MRLERVTVEGFGPLTNFDAVLEPKKLNLFIGPNESGKSSFASAIVSSLFGCASAEQEALSRPWAGGKHAVAVTFTTLTGRFRVRRDFTTHDVRVDRMAGSEDTVEATVFQGTANPRGRSAEQLQYEELLRGWFGFTEARLFRESSFVLENGLETQVSPELRHIVSGAVEADYQEIENALMERLDSLTREHPFDPKARKRMNRSIENRQERLGQLRERRKRSERVLTELKSRVAEQDEMETRLSELRSNLATKERLVTDLDAWLRLRDDQRRHLKRAPDIGTELVNVRRARGQVQDIDRKIREDLGYLANAPEEAEGDLMRLGVLRSQRARHQKTAEEERRKTDGSSPGSPIAAILIALVLGGGGAAAAWLTLHDPWIAGGIAGAGLAIGAWLGLTLGQKSRRSRSLAEAHVRVVEENIRTLSQEIDQVEIKVNPYLAGRTIEVVLEDVKRYRAIMQERRESAAVLQSLPMPERLEAESKEIDEAVTALRAKEKALLQQSPFLAPLREDPVKAAEAAERLRREATALRTKVQAEQESFDQTLRRGGGGGSSEGDAENLEILDETIAAEETTLAHEERQRDALLIALEVLRDSVLAYQEEHVHRLAREAGEILERLTEGRYVKVRLDADLKPTLATPERDDVPLESLSRGTRDGFYLALRAALAQELSAREPLPLILDDPIAHFDEERRGSLIRILEELAGEIQVLLLTHDRGVLNQVREANVTGVGAVARPRESKTKVQVRR
jgi:DNA repair exonuclease SbcCD ATPase subunit